jgi:RND family efflux transporter MFP subunit
MIRMMPRSAALLPLGAVLLVAACTATEEHTDEKKQAVVAANTIVVGIEPFTRTVSAIGTVVARPGAFAALSAPSAARVAKIYATPGQRVAQGGVLVEFEQQPFVTATNAAEAALAAAEKSYERAQRLVSEGIAPRKDAEQAAAEVSKARAEAILAQRAQQLSVIRSPINGVVTSLRAVLGAAADPAQVMVEVADPRAFDVTLSLSASEAGSVLPGAKVRLSAGERSGGESLGEGHVASIAATVDTVSRAVSVRVAMTTPRRPLRLGESVFGVIAIGTRKAVVIPIAALLPGEEIGAYKVFVVDAKGTALPRDVKIGGRDEARVEILEGLTAGEKVVTQGAFAVEDSAKVSKEVPAKDSTGKNEKKETP